MPAPDVPPCLADLGQRTEIMVRLHQTLVASFVLGRNRFDHDLAQVHLAPSHVSSWRRFYLTRTGKSSIEPNRLVQTPVISEGKLALPLLGLWRQWRDIRGNVGGHRTFRRAHVVPEPRYPSGFFSDNESALAAAQYASAPSLAASSEPRR